MINSEIAEQVRTEIMCGISKRVERVYLEGKTASNSLVI